MKYITGIQALNIEDSTECCGDWHTSSMDWKNLTFGESDGSIYDTWGIEADKTLPTYGDKKFYVANTMRAVLDLMQEEKYLRYLKGFRDDFFCTDKYNDEFFGQVMKLKNLEHWDGINHLMQMEFMFDWDRYRDTQEGVLKDESAYRGIMQKVLEDMRNGISRMDALRITPSPEAIAACNKFTDEE